MAGLALSSGLLAAGTTTVYQGKGVLSAVHAISDSTNVATVTVYDGLSAAGTILAKVNGTVNTGSNAAVFTTPIRCDIGITVVVSGAGTPQGIVHYGA